MTFRLKEINVNDKLYFYFSRLFLILGLFVFLSSIIGIFRSYSPVPFWDQWNGYLGFYIDVSQGDYLAWWSQHNEHRIIFSKILFWMDIKYFGGNSWFLLISNYLLQCFNLILICYLGRNFIRNTSDSVYFVGVGTTMLFSWLQHENMIWGFQSQFIAVYTFSLLSFMSLSFRGESSKWVLISCVFSMCAAFSMASGLVVFPVLVILGILLKIPFKNILIILISAIFVWCLYFYDYVSPPGHTSAFEGIKEHPLMVIRYVFTFIGSPFSELFESKFIGEFSGLFFIIVSFSYGISLLKSEDRSSAKFSLIAFILFIGGTALGTAAGRVEFGLDTARSSRYLTPVLLMWFSLFLLVLDSVNKRKVGKKTLTIFSLIVGVLFSFHQKPVFENFEESKFNKSMAVLSLDIGANDEKYTSKIFPSLGYLINITEEAKALDISIFSGNSLLTNEVINVERNTFDNCVGWYDDFSLISNNNDFVRVKGWVYSEELSKIDKVVFTNSKGVIVGEGRVGLKRSDVSSYLNIEDDYTGWEGYIPFTEGGYHAYAVYEDMYCKIPNGDIELSNLSVTISNFDADSDLSKLNIINNGGWIENGVFMGNSNDILPSIGSWVNGDEFTGTLSLLVPENSESYSFTYKTGPVSNSNYLSIVSVEGRELNRVNLPQSDKGWSKIEIDLSSFRSVSEVRVTDAGSGWGQWVAVMGDVDM